MTRRWIMVVLGVLVATGGVVALARVLGTGAGDGPTPPPCLAAPTADTRDARDIGGPVASATAQPGAEDYWTAERMRGASGAVHGEGEAAPVEDPDGTSRPCD